MHIFRFKGFNTVLKICTVASCSICSSVAPNDSNPICCENWAINGWANIGQCPINSWIKSGSGEWCGEPECRIYMVVWEWKMHSNHFQAFSKLGILFVLNENKPTWKTRNAKLAKKSRAESNPAHGRSVNPVFSKNKNQRTVSNDFPTLTKHSLLFVSVKLKLNVRKKKLSLYEIQELMLLRGKRKKIKAWTFENFNIFYYENYMVKLVK